MAVICRKCKRQYDITLFEFGRTVICDCGNIIDLKIQGMHREELKKKENQNEILS